MVDSVGEKKNLKGAKIQPVDEKGNAIGEAISVLFNPSAYVIEKSNQFQTTVLPGQSMPITHFINGNAGRLTMELFFDTYEKGSDVREYTTQVTNLLNIDAKLHAPPICQFIWGTVLFKGVLESVNQKFTLFLDSGIPVRATLNVAFKEYKSIEELFQTTPAQSPEKSKKYIIKQGDSLWLIASREYRDPNLWRKIAEANAINHPDRLKIGMEIIIPPLE